MAEAKVLVVKGVPASATATQVTQKFTSFGTISDVRLSQPSTATSQTAFISISITPENLHRCQSILGRSKWSGSQLSIQIAKSEYYIDRLAREKVEAAVKEKRRNRLIRKRNAARRKALAGPKPLTDDEARKAAGWAVGRFNRPLALVRIARPGGGIVKVTAEQTKETLQRFGVATFDVPCSSLTWSLGGDEYQPSQAHETSSDSDYDATDRGLTKRIKLDEADEEEESEIPSIYDDVNAEPDERFQLTESFKEIEEEESNEQSTKSQIDTANKLKTATPQTKKKRTFTVSASILDVIKPNVKSSFSFFDESEPSTDNKDNDAATSTATTEAVKEKQQTQQVIPVVPIKPIGQALSLTKQKLFVEIDTIKKHIDLMTEVAAKRDKGESLSELLENKTEPFMRTVSTQQVEAKWNETRSEKVANFHKKMKMAQQNSKSSRKTTSTTTTTE